MHAPARDRRRRHDRRHPRQHAAGAGTGSRKLKAQAPLLGEDPDFTAWFQNGEIDVACTISSNAREAANNGIKVDWTVPKEGATMDTDCLWIPKGLPEAELYWAKQYVNYAISPEGQQAW